MNFDPHPGPLVRALRATAGLTQEQLAELAGVPRSLLANVERCHRRGPSVLPRLAAALDVHVDVLRGRLPIVAILRRRQGVTAEDLAAAADITLTHLARIESGALPNPDVAVALGRRLGVEATALGPAPASVAA